MDDNAGMQNPLHKLESKIRYGWEISTEGYSRFIVDELRDGTTEHRCADLRQVPKPQPKQKARAASLARSTGVFWT